MTESSPPEPPELSGHGFERVLGRGGFADVFLFRQELPARPVAIKVLREPVRTEADRLRFENEANRMAALSSHPGIVTIYAVGTAPDGRPFISMEFCPRGHLGAVVGEQPLTVSRALEVGVKLAAAVETAHRASILHRDIKPANVLLTAYDEPALTDFGIAGGLEVGADDDVSHGVSIPFAAPEVTRDGIAGDETADVYSLGATVYALLAGRSPFQGPDVGSNAELLRRILAGSPPPTGRADVPASLEHVLATALRRDPGDRPDSALAFGRALQDVQVELGFDRTPMQLGGLAASEPVTRDPDDPDGTRLRPTARIEPGAGTAAGSSSRSGWGSSPVLSADDLGSRTVRRGGRVESVEAEAVPSEADPGDRAARRRRLIASAVGVFVVVAAVMFLLLRVGSGGDDDTVTTTTVAPDEALVVGGPPRPERVRIEPDDPSGQLVTWSVQGAAESDRFRVTITDGPAARRGEAALVEERFWSIDTDRRVCVVVETVRGAKVSETSREVCSR